MNLIHYVRRKGSDYHVVVKGIEDTTLEELFCVSINLQVFGGEMTGGITEIETFDEEIINIAKVLLQVKIRKQLKLPILKRTLIILYWK